MGRTTFGVTLAAVLLCADAGSAQQAPAPAADVTALAKQTQNPVGDLISIPLQVKARNDALLREYQRMLAESRAQRDHPPPPVV